MRAPGNTSRILFVLAYGLLLSTVAAAQPGDDCQRTELPAPAPGSTEIVVEQLEGVAVFGQPGDIRPRGGADGVCVLLYNPREKRVVAVAKTTAGGRFALPKPAAGTYVLSASAPYQHEILIPVRIADAPADAGAERGLLLFMRENGDRQKSVASMIGNLALRRELLQMVRADQEVRNEWIRKGVNMRDPELEARLRAIDSANTARIQNVVERYGWPGSDLVGYDAVEAAFLIVQHAAHDVQKKMFPHIEAAYRRGEMAGQNYALLLDRIRVSEGRPQVYGTQARPVEEWKNGEPTFAPIEDEANVDTRRAEVGLPTMAEYRELLKKMYMPGK